MTRRWRGRSLACVSGAALIAAVLAAPGVPSAQTSPRVVPPELFSLIRSARQDINTFWAAQVASYRPPVDVVMVQAPTTTDCGPFETPNAMYCASTHKIYWDVTLFSSQFRLGDFAPVFILAHEWGHLVQRQIGFGRTTDGLMGVQVELQADCLAGTYAANAAARKVMEAGDDDEAILALRRAGDGLDAAWFDSQAHGSSGQRIDAFSYGLAGRNCTSDAFFAFLKDRGIDPARIPQTPAPSQGTLAALLPRQAGPFALANVKRESIQGTTDALAAVYRTRDGIEVTTWLRAYPNAGFARELLDETITLAKERGLVEASRGNIVAANDPKTVISIMVVLRSRREVVMWSNGNTLVLVEGPFDVAQEFARAVKF